MITLSELIPITLLLSSLTLSAMDEKKQPPVEPERLLACLETNKDKLLFSGLYTVMKDRFARPRLDFSGYTELDEIVNGEYPPTYGGVDIRVLKTLEPKETLAAFKGFIAYYAHEDQEEAEICMVAVAKDAQRKGHALYMLETVISYLSNEGYLITTYLHHSDAVSHKLFEKLAQKNKLKLQSQDLLGIHKISLQ